MIIIIPLWRFRLSNDYYYYLKSEKSFVSFIIHHYIIVAINFKLAHQQVTWLEGPRHIVNCDGVCILVCCWVKVIKLEELLSSLADYTQSFSLSMLRRNVL